MSRFASAIRRHQVGAYVLLTYAFSWTAWKAFDRLYLAREIVAVPFITLGIFGPGVVAMSLSAVVAGARGPRLGSRASLLAFAIAWPAISALVALHLLLADGRPASMLTLVVSGACGLLPAGVLWAASSNAPGLRQHLASLLRPRGRARYYVLALVLFAGIWWLGVLLSPVLGVRVPQRFLPAEAVRAGLIGGIALAFLYNLLLNALPEEIGWRGFALPRLQARYSPLAASIIVSLFWAIWHIPAYRRGFAPQSIAETVFELVQLLPVAILFTWFYNRTGGSLLLVALLNAAMSTATHYLPVTVGGLLLLAACVVYAVVSDRMWRAPAPTETAAVSFGPDE